MDSTVVSDWFGSTFSNLHPKLQNIHIHGGCLSGPVEIEIPSGLAGIFGQRLAKRLGVPSDNKAHQLSVDISHRRGELHWNRSFDGVNQMNSVFRPIGQYPNGYWEEQTGPFKLFLSVDVIEGGWNWRIKRVYFKSLRLPKWLFPTSEAYKIIEDGKYRFVVQISLPIFGEVLSYGGLLKLSPREASSRAI